MTKVPYLSNFILRTAISPWIMLWDIFSLLLIMWVIIEIKGLQFWAWWRLDSLVMHCSLEREQLLGFLTFEEKGLPKYNINWRFLGVLNIGLNSIWASLAGTFPDTSSREGVNLYCISFGILIVCTQCRNLAHSAVSKTFWRGISSFPPQ